MRIYVAGPMTGYDQFNYPAFEDAATRLRAVGFEVVSPHEVNPPDGVEHPWDWYMRRDIAELVTCEAVAVLPGWLESKGARLETDIALALGMNIWALAELLVADVA